MKPEFRVRHGKVGEDVGQNKRTNLYGRGQRVPSQKYKDNYDKIKWGGNETEVEDTLDRLRNDGGRS